MKRIYLLLVALATCFTTFANFNIEGKVRDENGKPIHEVNCYIPSIGIGGITNSKGEFKFEGLNQSKFTIVFSHIGHETQEMTFKNINSNENIEVVMFSRNIQTGEVIVNATRANTKTPIAYNNVSGQEIFSNKVGKDIPALLSVLPSVVYSSESGSGYGNSSLRIRGTDQSRINVTVDGVPLNDPESHNVFWVNMPDFLSSVDNIQVQRGVGTSTNGAASFGASVNFKTNKVKSKEFVDIEYSSGSYNSKAITIKAGTGLSRQNIAIDFRYSDIESDGYIDNAFSKHKSMQFNGYYVGKNTFVKLSANIGDQKTGISWWGTPKEKLNRERTYNPAGLHVNEKGETNRYDNQTDNYKQNHFHAHISHYLNQYLKFNITGYTITGKGYYEQYKDKENWLESDNTKFASYGLPNFQDTITSTDVIRQKHLKNILYGGNGSLIFNSQATNATLGAGINKYDGDHFGKVLWTEFNNNNLPKNHEWYRNTGEKIDGNSYLKINQKISKFANVFVDLQYRHINYKMYGIDDDLKELNFDKNYNFFNPKLGILSDINNNMSGYISYAIANREPARADLKETTKDGGNQFPKHETLNDLEFGINFKSTLLAFNINAFYMNYKNQLVNTGAKNSVGYDLMTNVDKSYRRGIEISTHFKPHKRLSWKLNLTYNNSVIKDYKQTVSEYDADYKNKRKTTLNYGDVQTSYSPEFVGNSIINFDISDNLNFQFISKYIGEQYFDNTESSDRKIDAYFVNDINITYGFRPFGIRGFKLQASLNNVFNQEYESNAYGGFDIVAGKEQTWSYYFPQAKSNYMIRAILSF
jgi:iron complex outermembrane receptor protein